jgi:hypothetical protein
MTPTLNCYFCDTIKICHPVLCRDSSPIYHYVKQVMACDECCLRILVIREQLKELSCKDG